MITHMDRFNYEHSAEAFPGQINVAHRSIVSRNVLQRPAVSAK